MLNRPDDTAAEQYARAGGFALKTYFMDCIRRGNRSDIENQMIASQLREQMESVFQGNMDAMFIGVMLAWAQYVRAAVEGGIGEVIAGQYYVDYILQAQNAASIEELTELNIQILQNLADAVSIAQQEQGQQVLISQCREIVQSRIYEKITVQELADYFHFSRGYFSQRFKSATGTTVSQFIQYEKIQEAKHLLQFTSLPIVSIGTRLGFCSQSYFSSVFKQTCGITPKQYREETNPSQSVNKIM